MRFSEVIILIPTLFGSAVAMWPFYPNDQENSKLPSFRGVTNKASATKSEMYVGSVHVVRHLAGDSQADKDEYQAGVHVVPPNNRRIKGTVFEDKNRDGIQQDNEPGIKGVMVSDGLNVVKTDNKGEYRLPRPSLTEEISGFAVFITEPDGYKAPVNSAQVPQFFYIHKPSGSPPNVRGDKFRFGGLEPTGPLPAQINFPLVKTNKLRKFKIVVTGDPQPYSNNEVGYFRDSLIQELAGMDDLEAVIFMGDVMGDDLSLYKRFREIVSVAKTPQYYVAGNHDLDFDAPSDDHSFDTFRREFGPEYYSFDIGKVHFIVLDDVKYPCTPEDNFDGLHDFCDNPDTSPTYNGQITDRQLTWLKNDLEHVPKNRLIFLQQHIPIHTFIDMNLPKHMVDNVIELYETLGCKRSNDGWFYPEDCDRKIVSMGAHSHTNENQRPGEDFEGWLIALDERSPGPNPFHQFSVGAACGSWWTGDFDASVVPEAFQRLGSPKGYYIWEFDGASYKETFKSPDKPIEKQMSLDMLTPEFVDWFRALSEWSLSNPGPEDVPPFNINDLPDTKILTTAEQSNTYLSANIWNGSRDSSVVASFDHQDPIPMTRTQPGEGENILETLDPYALKRQMMVARHAYVTASDEPRANGYELFDGSPACGTDESSPCTPRPEDDWLWTDQSSHIWQVKIPSDLGVGTHSVKVMTTDAYGQEFEDTMAFEIYDERPPKFWQKELWEEEP